MSAHLDVQDRIQTPNLTARGQAMKRSTFLLSTAISVAMTTGALAQSLAPVPLHSAQAGSVGASPAPVTREASPARPDLGPAGPRPATARATRDGVVIDAPGFQARLRDGELVFAVEQPEGRAAERDRETDDDRRWRRALGYRLQSITSAGAPLYARAAGSLPAPEITGDATASYDLGNGLSERYEARPGGLEQIFRIEQPLPAGADLRIAGRFQSSFSAERAPGRGVLFNDPGGKEVLCYGEPMLIDATGQEVHGRLDIEGDALVLSFQPAQLEGLT